MFLLRRIVECYPGLPEKEYNINLNLTYLPMCTNTRQESENKIDAEQD